MPFFYTKDMKKVGLLPAYINKKRETLRINISFVSLILSGKNALLTKHAHSVRLFFKN